MIEQLLNDAPREALDEAKVDAFAERMLGHLNGGSLALMTSIGHRTGLFDALAELPPATSHEIARRTGLDERYVREWLGAMVTGGIVEAEVDVEAELDPELAKYSLPREHAACLTRAASPGNLAVTFQWMSVLGGVESRIVDCFRRGGGVPYGEFERFHEVMAEESAQTVVACLTSSILPLVEGLPERLTQGIDVLDVGCGSGRALMAMAAAHPRSRFTGYDLSPEATAAAAAEAREQGLENVAFECRDVTEIGAATEFDLVTAFDAIHDQAAPADVLRGIRSALKPDGVFLMQDIKSSSHVHRNVENPIAPFLYTISCMHCMTVSLAADGAGLGTCWGEELAVEMLKEAGFDSVEVSHLSHDIINSYYVARPGA